MSWSRRRTNLSQTLIWWLRGSSTKAGAAAFRSDSLMHTVECVMLTVGSQKKRTEKTTPFGFSLMTSQLWYRAAQVIGSHTFESQSWHANSNAVPWSTFSALQGSGNEWQKPSQVTDYVWLLTDFIKALHHLPWLHSKAHLATEVTSYMAISWAVD